MLEAVKTTILYIPCVRMPTGKYFRLMIDETEVTYDSYLEHVSGIQSSRTETDLLAEPDELEMWLCTYLRVWTRSTHLGDLVHLLTALVLTHELPSRRGECNQRTLPILQRITANQPIYSYWCYRRYCYPRTRRCWRYRTSVFALSCSVRQVAGAETK